MIGGIEETSASFEARSAPRSYPTASLRDLLAWIGQPIDAVAEARRKLNPTQRFGTAEEFGAACAFLCSAHASYITGQNLLMDGGQYPGTY